MNDKYLVKWKENRERIFRRDNSQPAKQDLQDNRPITYLKPKNQAPAAPSINNNQNQTGGYLQPIDHTASLNQGGYLEPLNKPVIKNDTNNQTSDYLQPNQENDTYIASNNTNNTSNNREIKDSYIDSSRYKPKYVNSYQEPGKPAYINDDVVNELNQRFSRNQQTTQFVDDYDDKESSSGYLAPRQSTNMSSTSSTAPLIKNNRLNGAKTKYAPPPPVQTTNNKFSLTRPSNETDV